MHDLPDYSVSFYNRRSNADPAVGGSRRYKIGSYVTLSAENVCDLEKIVQDLWPVGEENHEYIRIHGDRCARHVRVYYDLGKLMDILNSVSKPGRARVCVDIDMKRQSQASASHPIEWIALLTKNSSGSYETVATVEKNFAFFSKDTKIKRRVDIEINDLLSGIFLCIQIRPRIAEISIGDVSVRIECLSSRTAHIRVDSEKLGSAYVVLIGSRDCAIRAVAQNMLSSGRVQAIASRFTWFQVVVDGGVYSVRLAELASALGINPVTGGVVDLLVEQEDESCLARMALAFDADRIDWSARALHAHADVYREVQQALDSRSYNSALREIEDIPLEGDPKALQMAISALYGLRQYSRIIEFVERSAIGYSRYPAISQKYIESLIAEGRSNTAKLIIEKIVLDQNDCNDDVLDAVVVYSGIATAQLREALGRRILRRLKIENWKGKSIFRCAHNMIEDRNDELFFEYLSVINDDLNERVSDRVNKDILLSQYAFRGADYRRQGDYLIEAFKRTSPDNVVPIDSNRPIGPLNLRLCGSRIQDSAGPLVTVIISAFNCVNTLEASLRSILDQNYKNLEVIVVDDASTDGTRSIANSYRNMDSRVNILCNPRNVGPYVSRNRALEVATGEFVTCQDSDDWAHPAKIGASVKRLIYDASTIATGCQHVRVSDALGFRCRNEYVADDASSLMWRRELVLNRIGFFDSVRAGGDSEYVMRMQRVFGRGCIRYGSELHSIVRASSETITGSTEYYIDDLTGIGSATRCKYREAFTLWHESSDSLYIGTAINRKGRFYIPAELAVV